MDEDGDLEIIDDDYPEEGDESHIVIRDFAAIEDEVENIEKMCSLLTATQGEAARLNADDEGLVENLTSLGHDQKPHVAGSRLGKRNRYRQKSTRWRTQPALFRNTEYERRIPPLSPEGPSKRQQNFRMLHLNNCPIQFPSEVDISDDTVYIKIEISEPGFRHCDCYAVLARDEDPASRLAFRVRYVTSSGKEEAFYAKDANLPNVYRSNSFVDILIDEKPDLEIAETPRRYLYFTRDTAQLHEKLRRFIRGGFTSPLEK